MNCSHESQIAAFVDACLEPEASVAFLAHLDSCDTCRPLVEDLTAIRETAMRLDRHALPQALWTRIESKLPPSHATTEGRSHWWVAVIGSNRPWLPVAVGALALVIAAAGWMGWARSERTGQPAAPLSASVPVVESVEAELKLAEGHYERAISGLEQITAAAGGELDAQTSAVLLANLSVIDQAIGESRAALSGQPASLVAQESLFEALRSKVGLLQDTVALINEMRKGDQDGAARIISGFNP